MKAHVRINPLCGEIAVVVDDPPGPLGGVEVAIVSSWPSAFHHLVRSGLLSQIVEYKAKAELDESATQLEQLLQAVGVEVGPRYIMT